MTPPRFLLALAALGAMACSSPPGPGTCPGDRVATLQFQGTPAADASCPAAGDGGVAFTATLTFDQDGGARLCPERGQAAPLAGQQDGGHVLLTGEAAQTSLASCGCPVTVTEQLEGDLVRADGGVIGFTNGELRDRLEPPGDDPTGCEKDGGVACGVPCTARWVVSGSP